MSRWYQHVLTGQQVEVRSLEQDDYYVDNSSNWTRISAPSPVSAPAPVAEPEPEPQLKAEPKPAPKSRKR